MKKILLLSIGVFILLSQTSASVSAEPVPLNLFDIGYGVKISYEQFLSLSPKEYKKLTGHRLGIKKAIVLKIIQKKFSKQPYWSGGKNQLVAALLAFAIGVLGVHRFYLGYTWQGIVQLLTLGGCGIWSLIDFIRIIMGTLKPKDDEYETTL